MQWKTPKNSEKYFWTAHVSEKMHFYGLSEQKVLGVIKRPQRIETSIVENVVAVMIPVGNITKGIAKPKWGRPVFGSAPSGEDDGEKKDQNTWNQEIWVMYQTKTQNVKREALSKMQNPELEKLRKQINSSKQITIISAWRYPGVSPKNNPIPEDILREIEEIGLV